jgi:beta-lactam-binding protein with PASTA domain
MTTKVPDLRQMTVSEANKQALASGLNIRISGNALNAGELISYDQSLEVDEEVDCGKTITVYFKSDKGVVAGVYHHIGFIEDRGCTT